MIGFAKNVTLRREENGYKRMCLDLVTSCYKQRNGPVRHLMHSIVKTINTYHRVLYVEHCIWQVVQAPRALCCVCNVKRRNVSALVECEAVTARRLQSTALIRNAGHHPVRGVRRRRRMEDKIALTLQRGVTGTARMLHALTHSSISRQVREQM